MHSATPARAARATAHGRARGSGSRMRRASSGARNGTSADGGSSPPWIRRSRGSERADNVLSQHELPRSHPAGPLELLPEVVPGPDVGAVGGAEVPAGELARRERARDEPAPLLARPDLVVQLDEVPPVVDRRGERFDIVAPVGIT